MEPPNSGELKARQGKRGSHKTILRIITGLPAFGLIVAMVQFAPPIIISLVVAIAGVWGAFEYARMLARTPELKFSPVPLLMASALVGMGAMTGTSEALHGALLLGVLLLTITAMFRSRNSGTGGYDRAVLSLAGLLLIPWLLNHASLLLKLPDARVWILFMVVVVVVNDALAFAVGTGLGKHLLVPAISPSKTVEGSLGGLFGGFLVGALAFVFMPITRYSPTLFWMLTMGVVLAATGQAGDLLESWIKRRAGVKDSGIFLPGHGGLLDRVDAFLLAAPICYYMVLFYSASNGNPLSLLNGY